MKLNDGRCYKVRAPIGLIKAAIGIGGFGASFARKYVPEEHRHYIESIDFRELKKGFDVLKDYKGLQMLDVKAGDGTEVNIKL